MNEDEIFMNEAIQEAKLALNEGNWPIGCVIVLDNKIISKAHNQVYSKNNKLAHAEIQALQEAQSILLQNKKKATLYTTYEPCPMCFGATILSRIKRVVSGINVDNSGSMHLKEHLPKLFRLEKFDVEFVQGILSKECYEVFVKGEPTKELMKEGLLNNKPQI